MGQVITPMQGANQIRPYMPPTEAQLSRANRSLYPESQNPEITQALLAPQQRELSEPSQELPRTLNLRQQGELFSRMPQEAATQAGLNVSGTVFDQNEYNRQRQKEELQSQLPKLKEEQLNKAQTLDGAQGPSVAEEILWAEKELSRHYQEANALRKRRAKKQIVVGRNQTLIETSRKRSSGSFDRGLLQLVRKIIRSMQEGLSREQALHTFHQENQLRLQKKRQTGAGMEGAAGQKADMMAAFSNGERRSETPQQDDFTFSEVNGQIGE